MRAHSGWARRRRAAALLGTRVARLHQGELGIRFAVVVGGMVAGGELATAGGGWLWRPTTRGLAVAGEEGDGGWRGSGRSGEAGETPSREEKGRGPLVDADRGLGASGRRWTRRELARARRRRKEGARPGVMLGEEWRGFNRPREGRRRPATASSSPTVKGDDGGGSLEKKSKRRERWLSRRTNWRRQRLLYSANEVTGTVPWPPTPPASRWPDATGSRRSKNPVSSG
jgi:hypothetical protein